MPRPFSPRSMSLDSEAFESHMETTPLRGDVVAYVEAFFLQHDLKLFKLFSASSALNCARSIEAAASFSVRRFHPIFSEADAGRPPRARARARKPRRQPLIGLRSLRLARKRLELPLYLGGDVFDSIEMCIHRGKLVGAAVLALLMLQDAGGFFDKRTSVFRAACQNGVQIALPYDGQRVPVPRPVS